ncbi:hypothetical protein [Nocardia sp. NPDC006630]|uniref:hypothetical protein n=1 Tax=Nocardia sp. NPDC006630 TaxID=3157181 RepID=UPI0033B4B029
MGFEAAVGGGAGCLEFNEFAFHIGFEGRGEPGVGVIAEHGFDIVWRLACDREFPCAVGGFLEQPQHALSFAEHGLPQWLDGSTDGRGGGAGGIDILTGPAQLGDHHRERRTAGAAGPAGREALRHTVLGSPLRFGLVERLHQFRSRTVEFREIGAALLVVCGLQGAEVDIMWRRERLVVERQEPLPVLQPGRAVIQDVVDRFAAHIEGHGCTPDTAAARS